MFPFSRFVWILLWSLVRIELAESPDSHRFSQSVPRPSLSSLLQCPTLLCPCFKLSTAFLPSAFPCLIHEPTEEFVNYCLSFICVIVSCGLQHTLRYMQPLCLCNSLLHSIVMNKLCNLYYLMCLVYLCVLRYYICSLPTVFKYLSHSEAICKIHFSYPH